MYGQSEEVAEGAIPGLAMAKKKQRKLSIAQANRAYFMVLSETRGSLGSLIIVSGVTTFLLFLFYVILGPVAGVAELYSGYPLAQHLLNWAMVLMWACAGVLVVSWLTLTFFWGLVERFQVLLSWVLVATGFLMVCTVCFLAVGATSSNRFGVEPRLFIVALIGAGVLIVGSTLVHALMLRHRLRVGHSAERTMKNVIAVSSRTCSLGSSTRSIFLLAQCWCSSRACCLVSQSRWRISPI